MTSATSSPIAGNSSPKILAVDTSTAVGSLALSHLGANFETELIKEVHWQKKAMHSEVATLELERLLKDTACQLEDITHFALNIGPGSFTGLRVGINLVRTLAYCFDRPVAMFSSLEVLAFLHGQKSETVLVASKAVQNYYYAAKFTLTASDAGPRVTTLVQPFSTVDFSGEQDCKLLIEGTTPNFNIQTSAQNMNAMIKGSSFFSWKDVKPLYVRGSEAEEKMKKGLLKPLS